MKRFSTDNLNRIFEEVDYTGFKNLMFDLSDKKEIYDEAEERVIRPDEANAKIRKVCYSILNIDEHSSKRDINRALKKHGQELFEVIEEVIDMKVATGFRENEFFNDFVETRNIAEGDSVEFWTDDDIILNVAKVAGDHHDLGLDGVCIA